jgi:threonine/homoserine/homoserine lactone efflux protein
MSYRQPIGTVEDYTDAFLTTLGVIFFMAFWMIAAAFGYLWVAITAYSISKFFKWIDRFQAD